ncbi:MAG: hypothetical protein H7X80_00290, partial [bacterium]|nr:hypothetical protein [Candidatus Kapabacteria bacterium]
RTSDEFGFTSIVVSATGTFIAASAGLGQHVYRSTDDGLTWASQPVRAAFLSVSRDGIFYSSYMSVMRSSDDGRSWQPILESAAAALVAVGDSEVIATAYDQVSDQVDTLYRSTNRGTTWQSMPGKWMGRLVAGDDGTVFALPWHPLIQQKVGGVYRLSADRRSYDSIRSDVVVTMIEGRAGEWLAAGHETILSTTDDGASWSERARGFGAQTIRHLSRGAGRALFAVGGAYELWSSSTGRYNLYRSDDDGDSWTRVHTLIADGLDASEHVIFAARSEYASSSSLLYSFDNGTSWDSLGLAYPGFYSFFSGSANANGRAAVATMDSVGNLVHVTTNRGLSWTTYRAAPIVTRVRYLANNRLLLARQIGARETSELASSTDDGATWRTAIDSFEERNIIVTPDDVVYAFGVNYASDSMVVHRSRDGGASFEQVHAFARDVQSMAVTPSGHLLVYSGQRILRSTDDGDTWHVLNAPIVSDARRIVSGRHLYTYGTIYFDPNRVLFRSTDDGDTWHRIDGPYPLNKPTSFVLTADEDLLV